MSEDITPDGYEEAMDLYDLFHQDEDLFIRTIQDTPENERRIRGIL